MQAYNYFVTMMLLTSAFLGLTFVSATVPVHVKPERWHHPSNLMPERRTSGQQTSNTSLQATEIKTTSLLQKLLLSVSDDDDLTLQLLISFLFDGSTGRNVYFFHDRRRASVISSSASRCNQRGAEVTVFTCEEAMTYLKKLIKSFNQLESVRNVFVLCSTSVTKNMFKEIHQYYLESAVTHWFVILQDDIFDSILPFMREGTQVTFAKKRQPYTYDLMNSYVNIDNTIALQEIGYWSWNKVTGVKSRLKAPIYRPVIEVYSDFGGRKLTVTLIDNWPFWIIEYPEDGRVIATSGLDYNVFSTIGQKLNFTFGVMLTPDRMWGGVMADGSVTGMVGVVHRHEAHAAINEFTITEQREKAVDFTKPYYYESCTLISPAPTKKVRTYAIFTSFTYEVWIFLLIVVIIIGPIVMLIVWLRNWLFDEVVDKRWSDLQDVSLMMFRSLVMQGSKVPSDGWVHRIIFISWFFFSTLMISLYSDVMIAVLAVPSYEKPIDSLYDLLDAIHERDFVTVLGCGSNNEFIYSSTTMQIYKDIWKEFDYSKGCIKTWDEGMDKVLTGKYAFSNNRLGAEVRANLRGRDRFHFARNEFYAHGYSIACPNGSPYKTAFEEVLIKEMSFGLVNKYTNDELERARKGSGETEKGPEAIGIQHLQAAFFMMAFGLFGGIVLLMCEWWTHSYKMKDEVW